MVLATVSAFAMIWFDRTWGKDIVEAFPVFEMSPPAARSILSTIVGAMVSTTGVVFSITIVALSLASSQFGSRLIRTYRKRLSTHYTLGIFVSTSLFCILVLASIREVEGASFVPTLSVLVGITLTVICLATLIYYIDDMSQAIQAPNVIQKSANDLDDAVERLFPEAFGEAADRDSAEAANVTASEDLGPPQFTVCCDEVGYLQAVQNETVMHLADEEDLVVRLLVRPGDFLYIDKKLAEVWVKQPLSDEAESAESAESAEESISNRIRNSLIVGPNRTHIQDARYAFNELVDIAVRALSPGINDPFTAMNCIDRIHAALLSLQKREIPSSHRTNEDGKLRVIASPIRLQECIDGSLKMIADYAKDDPQVKQHIEESLKSLNSANHETPDNESTRCDRNESKADQR